MSPEPQRSCIGCRAARPKSELVRLAAPEGAVAVDWQGLLSGRGAYLCRATALSCLEQSRKKRALPRALRIGENVIGYDRLVDEIKSHLEG